MPYIDRVNETQSKTFGTIEDVITSAIAAGVSPEYIQRVQKDWDAINQSYEGSPPEDFIPYAISKFAAAIPRY
jgi:hypothetical protein